LNGYILRNNDWDNSIRRHWYSRRDLEKQLSVIGSETMAIIDDNPGARSLRKDRGKVRAQATCPKRSSLGCAYQPA